MRDAATALKIGLISDTHDVLRPQARDALAGVAHILHAGDICESHVLAELAAIAPVTAVRGNNDRGEWAARLAESEAVEVAGRWLYVLHDLHELDLDPAAGGFAAVIAGHSHKPKIEEKKGVLFVNPGSAGPRRFTLPIAVARLHIGRGGIQAETVLL